MLASDLLATFIVGVVFLSALGSLGGSLTFGIFVALAIVSFVFIYLLAPEIKGRQLWRRSGSTGTTAPSGRMR